MTGKISARFRLSIWHVAAASLAVAGGLAVHARLARAANSPLPALNTKVQPVVFFLLDNSQSMGNCDGGLYDPKPDATPLFDPAADSSTSSSTSLPAGSDDDTPVAGCHADSDSTYSYRKDGTKRPYNLNRLEALKLALAKMLDANGDGVLDSSDELLLNVRMGLGTFAVVSIYDMSVLQPVGSSFASVWNSAKALTGTMDTPSGEALIGARDLGLQPCYDNLTSNNAQCNLGTNQLDASGNDKAITCRDYFVVFLTDGQPFLSFSDATLSRDPISASKKLMQKTAAVGAVGEVNPSGGPVIHTIMIGFSSTTSAVTTTERGVVNCTTYWGNDTAMGGLRIADADKDGDNNYLTMAATIGTETTVACTDMASLTAAEKGYGNGYFANDSKQLVTTFQQILNAIQAGTYSRSQPIAFNSGSTASGESVYGAYFDITPSSVDWKGHLRKYQFDATTGNYQDCNTTTASANPKPCWDAGGWYGGTDPRTGTPPAMLYERDWTTRVVLTVNPSNLVFEPDLTKEKNESPSSDSTNTVVNIVPLLSTYTMPMTTAQVTSLSSGTLYQLAAISEIKTGSTTYKIDGSETVPNVAKADALDALTFAAGRPTARFIDGSTRCVSGMTCTDSASSPKLGDSFNSRPVIVGPPLGLVTDGDYQTEFLTRTLDTGSAVFDQGHYSGNELIKAGTATSSCPTGVTTCDVAHRRTVVYLASNDGQLHAYDDATGYELWSFIPPGHLPKLSRQRSVRTSYIDGLPTVRDIKFPCQRSGSACAATGQDPFEDGKWHTLITYGQGTGGDFFFTMDITNPMKPVFLWEYRKPDKMGYTVARATAGQIPNTSGFPAKDKPGVVFFITGGLLPDNGGALDVDDDDPVGVTKHAHFYTIIPYNGKKLKDHHTNPFDLPDTSTRTPVLNGLTGEPRAVDGDLDGTIGRVYFGDREGRMWKACNITESGDFSTVMFFDPALYDLKPNGTNYGVPSSNSSTTPLNGLGLTATQLSARQTLRGPLFYQPDVTHDATGNILVAFGSGNVLDPLSSPTDYRNFVWEIQDTAGDSCALPQAKTCTGAATGSYTTSGTITFNNVVPVSDLLTGPPLIFKSFLLYAQFDPDMNNNGDPCENDTQSQIKAIDAFNCTNPTATAFVDGSGTATNTLTFSNTLVTGVQVDAVSGSIFTMKSVPAGSAPTTAKAPNLQVLPSYAGYRQMD